VDFYKKEIIMSADGRLKDKVAIITGAASGIGSATAVLFAREGARLVLADVDEKGLKETAGLISETDAAVIIKKTDVAMEEEVKALINLALDTFSQVDILCNNAGITGDMSSLNDQDQSIWHQVYDVNVLGAVLAVKHIAKHMQARQKVRVSGIRFMMLTSWVPYWRSNILPNICRQDKREPL
jgi:NAD(P)-dependent dehydrogenase (short-subunit alcohol dehydrogenase family)